MNKPSPLRTISLCIALTLTAGCATTQVNPHHVCAQPTVVILPTRPTLAISRLTPEATKDELLTAYTASLYQCVGYANELRVLLKPTKPFN